jgi:hypothetical protein
MCLTFPPTDPAASVNPTPALMKAWTCCSQACRRPWAAPHPAERPAPPPTSHVGCPPPPPPGAAAAHLAAEDIVTHSSAAEGWMPTQESNCALVALHLRATARPCMISAASGPTCVEAGKGGGSVWVWVWGELSE